jgi:hypothetical protein
MCIANMVYAESDYIRDYKFYKEFINGDQGEKNVII